MATKNTVSNPSRERSAGGGVRLLSKSKLQAFRQCERRLWLEIHRPELRKDSDAAQARFATGHQVGDIARRSYDPQSHGTLIDAQKDGWREAFARTQALLRSSRPLFEAGFAADGALAFADVMLPQRAGNKLAWRMIEVKSSTQVKPYHLDDVAIQCHIARCAGVRLVGAAVAHVDSKWVYPGGGDYRGLLIEQDVTDQSFERGTEVRSWIEAAQAVVRLPREPERRTGAHCADPFECGFQDHCKTAEPQAEFPVAWLPRVQTKAIKDHLARTGATDMRDVPDDLLNPQQLRVKTQSLEGRAWFDAAAAARELRGHDAPLCFLDFETVQFVVPVWAGTRPYEQVTFQFSLHRLLPDGRLEHEEFLDLGGGDPSESFAAALLKACGRDGAVFVYNASFEKGRMQALGARFPRWRAKLKALESRVVDLLPIARSCYYHPSQQGSWSIKKVLPSVVPELRYDALEGVQDGGAAMNAFLEAIAPATAPEQRLRLRQQLVAYCRLDTYAMVRLWQVFAGRRDLRL